MKSRSHEELESTLERVDPSRRSFLKRILIGAGAAILATLPDSTLLAQVPPAAPEQDRGGSDGCGGGPGGGGRGGRGGRGAGVPRVPPGNYTVVITAGGNTATGTISVEG